MKGQSTSGVCALVTGCGSRCVAPEKKLAILSLNEVEPDDGGAAEASAGAAAVPGLPMVLPLLHPDANSASASMPATGTRSHQAFR